MEVLVHKNLVDTVAATQAAAVQQGLSSNQNRRKSDHGPVFTGVGGTSMPITNTSNNANGIYINYKLLEFFACRGWVI